MPKQVDPTEKRTELVAATWDVIATEGLQGASLRRIAAEAGVTTGALTHYFTDRQSLLIASLRAVHYQAGARMLAALQRSSEPVERLRAVLLESLPLDAERLKEWRVWLAFWAESMNDPELDEESSLRYDEWRVLLEELIAAFGRDGETAEEAAEVLALVDGLGLRLARHAEDDPVLLSQQRECEATLVRYLQRFEGGTP